jgi:hypothetical protein
MFTENNFDSAISTQSNDVVTQSFRKPIFEPHDKFLGCEWGYVQNLDMPLYAEINGSKAYFKTLEKVYLAIFESKKEQHKELERLMNLKTSGNSYVFKLCETDYGKLGVIAFDSEERNRNSTTKEKDCETNFDLANKGNDNYIFIAWNGKDYDLHFPCNKVTKKVSFENMITVVEVYLNHWVKI